jgi:2-hydroxy-3-keto-5-methylthiopentenyl-1-phosphate phosphatase
MIIQCDFDGTIITNNMSLLLREEFAAGAWRQLENDYLHGYLTVEQSNMLQFTLIKEPKEKLQEFICQHIEVRPGFLEFVRYCRDTGIPLVIVSSGLDFYIETVLTQIGMRNLELHCGQTTFGKDGIIASYTDPTGNIINEGFKIKYLDWLRKRDTNITYIGDGLSDLEAARNADHVFATSHLLRLLNNDSIACSAFSDFFDLRRHFNPDGLTIPDKE